MKPITVAVIGCGYWGPNLLRNFAETETADLRWICDTDEERLATMARRYPGAPATTHYQRLLRDPYVDHIANVTPRATHFEIAKKPPGSGKNALVQEPPQSDRPKPARTNQTTDRDG